MIDPFVYHACMLLSLIQILELLLSELLLLSKTQPRSKAEGWRNAQQAFGRKYNAYENTSPGKLGNLLEKTQAELKFGMMLYYHLLMNSISSPLLHP